MGRQGTKDKEMHLEALQSVWGMWQAQAPLLPRSGGGELDIGQEEEDPLIKILKCEDVDHSCEKE